MKDGQGDGRKDCHSPLMAGVENRSMALDSSPIMSKGHCATLETKTWNNEAVSTASFSVAMFFHVLETMWIGSVEVDNLRAAQEANP
jgi:hypothetical protein